MHHCDGHQASGLGTETTVAQMYRLVSSRDCLLHLVDGEITLRTYHDGDGVGNDGVDRGSVEEADTGNLLITVGDILTALDRLGDEVLEGDHLVENRFPGLAALLHGRDSDLL